ncbi:MAG: VOC family protein [Solirubrobacteraceae bacterium]
MTQVLTSAQLPPGYGSINPFVSISGPGGASAFIIFVSEVFGGQETLAAHSVDSDELLIHAEIRVGDSTIMCFDAKPDWPFTPALLQVYVADALEVSDRARAHGAEVFTEPIAFFGKQRLARLRDPWSNLWWLFEFGPESVAPSQAPDEPSGWRPDPDAPESYSHATITAQMRHLTRP